MSKLCILPWISQSYRANGDIRICCQAQHGPTNGILRGTNNNVLNAKNANLTDARNSPLAKEIRASMMNGNWHPECVRCQTEEESGMLSRREVENKIWIKGGEYLQLKEENRFTWKNLLENTDNDGTLNTSNIKNAFYDLRFGNKCNLKCRMCGPTDSDQWYDDQANLWGDEYTDSHGVVKLIKNNSGRYQPEINVYNWHEGNYFWNQMEEQIHNIQKLYIVGGEPFLIEQHYNFLQKCVDQGVAKNIVVEYNSNITNIPTKAWDIWKHFYRIGIGASIDAIGDLNHYIRYPSKFSIIWRNLEKLSAAEGNFKMWMATTISVYNVLVLPEILEFILKNKLPRVNDDDNKPIMTPHPLHGPHFLNIRMLPKNVKNIVAKKFNDWKPKLSDTIDEYITNERRKKSSKKQMNDILDTYINFMFAKDMSSSLPKFWEHTDKLDNMREIYFKDYCPEMYDLLKCYN